MGGAAVVAALISNAIGGFGDGPAPMVVQVQAPSSAPRPAPAPAPSPPAAAPAKEPAPSSAPQAPAGPEVFGFATVERLARERAAQPYENRSPKLPPSLAKLTYDQYRDIRFRRNVALWHNQSLFEVQFFHRGFNFARRVDISEVYDGVAHPIQYNPAWFEFGRLTRVPAKLPHDLGFAGFRVHYPLQTPAYKDELIVFLGASYFRVLGRNQAYGLSARGLAINTASTSGEEFPWFTDFWLVRPPSPEQRTLTLYALLDSESVVGAYQFDVRPGSTTQVEVTSELFPRKNIEKLGVAALTSMYLYGEDPAGHRFDDFRPEVHDSDGLMAQTGGGEWLWRPLNNPHELHVNRFMDERPRGFGLIQRDRDFNHYQDNESRFEHRPSYWIQPLGDWGKGGVELVEIPTDEEIHDNVVAYWVPTAPVEAGKPLKFQYLLTAHSDSPQWPPGGKAIATRTGNAAVIGVAKEKDEGRRMVIDFAGGDLDGLDRSQPVKAFVSANGGQVDTVTVERLPENGAWRVTFRVPPTRGKQPVDLRCYLTLYGEALTETWMYQLTS
jgi:glucans biosynthesis protein